MRFTLIGCCALLLWASSFPVAKRCSEEIGSITLAALVYSVGGLLGLLTNFFTGNLERSKLNFLRCKEFYVRTLLLSAYLVSIYFAIGAVERPQLPVVTLLSYFWPTFTMILSVWFLRQRCRPILLIMGSFIVIVGLAIEIVGERVTSVFFQEHSATTVMAFIAAFFGAVVWAVYTVLNRFWGERAGGVVGLPFAMLIAATGLWGLRFALNESSVFTTDVSAPLAYMLVVPYLGNLCWDVGTRRGNITFLSLLADGLPWASLTVASLYLGIVVDATTWISAALVVAGALMSRASLFRVG